MNLDLRTAQDIITVVLVVEQEFTRHGVKALLSHEGRVSVIGDEADDEESFSLISEFRPDVVILDVPSRRDSEPDLCRYIKTISPRTNILVLTSHYEDQRAGSLATAGVSRYLPKSASGGDLVSAVYEAADGRLVFLPVTRNGKHGTSILSSGTDGAQSTAAHGNLTSREIEVLKHMGQGLRNQEIADTLGISPRTVETHIRHVLLKLGVNSRTKAVLLAMKYGVLP